LILRNSALVSTLSHSCSRIWESCRPRLRQAEFT